MYKSKEDWGVQAKMFVSCAGLLFYHIHWKDILYKG